jgi:amino-acid N-acetyltransferase
MHAGKDPSIKPTDLRGILKYVPLFRNEVFVVALDGLMVADESFYNLARDIAVLRSLSIDVVLVHGIGYQLQQLTAQEGMGVTDLDGLGPVDEGTLALALQGTAEASHRIFRELSQAGLKYACANAVRATEAGVIRGVDQGFRGKVDKIDLPLVQHLLKDGIVPVFSPIAFTAEGTTLRINAELLATDLAIGLEASKVIYVSPQAGLTVNGRFECNVPVEEIRTVLEKDPGAIDEDGRYKAEQAVRAIEAGVPRAHIIDGRIYDGLVTEIFSKIGIGTMIHGNAYRQIRRAQTRDLTSIHNILKLAVRDDVLRPRSRQSIEREISRFYVYEIDDSLVGCFSLHPYEASDAIELATVAVRPGYENRGIGRRLVEYACIEAAREGAARLFVLSTQSFSFFKRICRFEEGTVDHLPEARRRSLEKSGRNSRILVTTLEEPHLD